MSFTKFRHQDVYFNTIKAHPSYSFFIYQNEIFFKSKDGLDPRGHESLYELNVNRQSTLNSKGEQVGLIYPFISKDGARTAFKTISASDFDDTSQFQFGDILTGSYPLTASVSRIKIPAGENIIKLTDPDDAPGFQGADVNKKYINALKTVLDSHYGRHSQHYRFSSSVADYNWDKGKQEINLICVPSIFYGSGIKKGSVTLRSYISGTMVGELIDKNKNGELIETTGSAVDSVAGVVLYEHGIMLLTGSWDLTLIHALRHDGAPSPVSSIQWLNFASGMPKVSGKDSVNLISSSYEVTFEGTNIIPTLTLLAHAPKNQKNLSSNPTAVQFDKMIQSHLFADGFTQSGGAIKNIEKSRYSSHTASFVKQVFISKIGIYDEKGHLLGISTLANPVRKKEKDEYTFRLKLDF